MELFQQVILSQIVIISALVLVFLLVSRWALAVFEEYPGYFLGVLIGIFFIIVRLSVGETQPINPETGSPIIYLNAFQVFASTIFGLGVGGAIVTGLRFGMRHPQMISLQVAIYTALNIILIFLAFIGNPIIQKMVGIFALCVGIALLLVMVLFPTPKRRETLNIKAQGITGTQSAPTIDPQNSGQGGGANMPQSRLDKIRQSQNSKLGR